MDYECKNCGRFGLTADALEAVRDDAWKLASYVVEQNLRDIPPTFYLAQKHVSSESPAGSVGVDAVIEAFPKSASERLDRALINLASKTHYLGSAGYDLRIVFQFVQHNHREAILLEAAGITLLVDLRQCLV